MGSANGFNTARDQHDRSAYNSSNGDVPMEDICYYIGMKPITNRRKILYAINS